MNQVIRIFFIYAVLAGLVTLLLSSKKQYRSIEESTLFIDKNLEILCNSFHTCKNCESQKMKVDLMSADLNSFINVQVDSIDLFKSELEKSYGVLPEQKLKAINHLYRYEELLKVICKDR